MLLVWCRSVMNDTLLPLPSWLVGSTTRTTNTGNLLLTNLLSFRYYIHYCLPHPSHNVEEQISIPLFCSAWCIHLSMFCSAGWFENWGESWRICSAGLILNLQTQHNRQRVHNFTRNVHHHPQPAMVGNRVSRFKWFKSVSSLFVINSLIEHVLSP